MNWAQQIDNRVKDWLYTVAAGRSDERSHITVARVIAPLLDALSAVVARVVIAHFDWTCTTDPRTVVILCLLLLGLLLASWRSGYELTIRYEMLS